MSRLIEMLTNVIFRGKGKPLQLLGKRTLEKSSLSREQTRERIKLALQNRRVQGELPELPERPRIFVAVKNTNWEQAALVDSFRGLADVVHYDWGDKYDQYSLDWHTRRKQEFCLELVSKVVEEHRKGQIDIFFSYLSGRWVFPETIRQIRKLGIITVNFDFDDSYKFWGDREATGLTGSAEIAPAFDICISAQSERNIGKYIAVGANPLFLPSAGNPKVFGSREPLPDRKIAVSFIGQNYGQRGEMVKILRSEGIDVLTRGSGWPEGPVSQEEMLDIYQNSLLTLGFSFIAGTNSVGLKGRDFEVPMTGAAYLTTYNAELARYFVPDKEIIFYKSPRELRDKVLYILSNPEEGIKIGLAGRERALRDHTWEKRWLKLWEVCR